MPSRSGARLASAFLIYLVGVVILVTLVPFDFSIAPQHPLLWRGNGADALANVAMFFPLGFLFRLTREPRADRWAIRPLLWGLGFSICVEAVQLFLPSRFSSPVDVATNGLGAWLGAIAHDLRRRRLRSTPALVGMLALELPLMGLVYLLIPLLWLSGLAASGDPARMGLSPPLGLMGAIVLGAIHRHRVRPAGAAGVARFAVLAGAWYLVGAIPGLKERPAIVLASALLVAGVTAISAASRTSEAPQADRRFEAGTLLRVAPVLALYLVCLAGWPPRTPITPWHGEIGMRGFWRDAETTAILRALEHFAAFTVLGYALAEHRGRQELSFRLSLPALAGWSVVAAALLELVAPLHSAAGASVLRGCLAVSAAVYGGGIYHLQRTHIRWLLGADRSEPPEARQSAPATRGNPVQTGRIAAPGWAARRG